MINLSILSVLHWPLTKQLSKTGRFIKYYEDADYSCNEYLLEESKILIKKPKRNNQKGNEDRIYLRSWNTTIQAKEQLQQMFIYMSGKYCLPLSDIVDESLFLPMDLPNSEVIRKTRHQIFNRFYNSTMQSIHRIFS